MFDLLTARTRLKFTDNSHDVELATAMTTVKKLVEKYLDRLLDYNRETIKVYEIGLNKVFVPRYPIEKVYSIKGKTLGDYTVHHLNGWIKGPFPDNAQVDYSGGYKVYPLDLVFALWEIFDLIWDEMYAGGGTTSAGIHRVTLQDVGTITFATPSGSSGSGGAGDLAGLPGSVMSILNLYKRWSC